MSRGWLELVVEVEAQVTVAPVQHPGPGGLGIAKPGDGESCPFRAGALAPGRTALDDRQVPGAYVAFHPDLVPGMLRDALLAPAADAGDVEFGRSWHLVSVPGGGWRVAARSRARVASGLGSTTGTDPRQSLALPSLVSRSSRVSRLIAAGRWA